MYTKRLSISWKKRLLHTCTVLHHVSKVIYFKFNLIFINESPLMIVFFSNNFKCFLIDLTLMEKTVSFLTTTHQVRQRRTFLILKTMRFVCFKYFLLYCNGSFRFQTNELVISLPESASTKIQLPKSPTSGTGRLKKPMFGTAISPSESFSTSTHLNNQAFVFGLCYYYCSTT